MIQGLLKSEGINLCGLTGVMGRNLSLLDIKIFKDMLFATMIRGPHSTGVMSASEYGKTILQKDDIDSLAFVNWFGGKGGYLERPGQIALMGHCRYATVGKVTAKNAHPYDVGRFIGAHNGTLHDYEFTPKKGDTRTDSELMFRAMVERGIKPVLDHLDYWSAYAISIYEKETKKMFLGRNTERPLWIAVDEESDKVYYASEPRIIQFGVMGEGSQPRVNVKYFKIPMDQVWEFDILNMTRGSMWSVHEILPAVLPKEYKKHSPGVLSGTMGDLSNSTSSYPASYTSSNSNTNKKAVDVPWEDEDKKSFTETEGGNVILI